MPTIATGAGVPEGCCLGGGAGPAVAPPASGSRDAILIGSRICYDESLGMNQRMLRGQNTKEITGEKEVVLIYSSRRCC